MRVTSSGAYARPPPTPKMPPGLIELMEGLAKDVLKNNPEDVYEFCAGHLQKLLEIRDGTVPKKQLSLDEKIKRAQEKIQQRIKDRQLQYQKETSELPNENIIEKKEESNSEASIEVPLENSTSLKQPVLHGDELVKTSEVEIFHEPDVIITSTSNEGDLLKKEFEQCPPLDTETIQDSELITTVNEEVKESHVNAKSDKPITMGTLQSEKSYEIKKMPEESKVVRGDPTPTKPGKSKDKEEKEPGEVIIDQDISAPSEAIQAEAFTNDVKEKLNQNIDETEPIPNLTLFKNQKSELEVAVKENDNNEEIVSKINQVIDKPENIGVTNHKRISNETQNTDFPTKSEENLKLSDSTIDNKIEESKDEENTTAIEDQKITKNEHEEKDVIPNQQIKENFESVNMPSKIANDATEIEEVNDVIANQDVKSFNSKSDETKVVVESECNRNNESNDNITVTNESRIEKPGDSNVTLIEPPLQGLAINENLSSAKHPDPLAETTMLVKLITANEALPTAIQEHSNDYIDDNVQHSHIDSKSPVGEDIDKNTIGEKHQHADKQQLLMNESEGILNNASDLRKNDVISESDEPIENAEGSGMDLETAAITIQKVFRTFLFSKSRTSTLDDTANDNSMDEEIEKKDEPQYMITSANLNKERRTLGISRMDTVLQTVNEEKSLSLSDDSSTLSSAATTIQAHVRGFLVRNRLASYKTASNSSLVNSEGPSIDGDTNEPKKTILNIHIVPERGQFMSRDESILTSIDLPLDNSPPSSINLHPLGYDKSEPRKQLKREDAIQSISPPSNNSGKLSEEVDSVKDSLELKQEENSTNLELKLEENSTISLTSNDKRQDADAESCDTTLTISSTADTVIDAETYTAREVLSSPEHHLETDAKNESATNFSSDEMDVVTPFPNATEKPVQEIESDEKPKLVHTGEFHDIVLQTQVKRSESSVVRGE